MTHLSFRAKPRSSHCWSELLCCNVLGWNGAKRGICFSLVLTILAVSALVTLAQKQAPKAAPGALIYVGALPGQVLVIDEAQEKIVDRIPCQTGVPRNLILSYDKKKLYVGTIRNNGMETIDLATRKTISHFVLNEGNRTMRFRGAAVDPQDRFIYAGLMVVTKQLDRFEFDKPKFAVIDLAQKKITRTVDFPKEEDSLFGLRGDYRVSPDGKFLYIFGDDVRIFDTTDFKQVEKIELSKPLDLYPGMETVRVGLYDDPHDEPGIVTSLFNSTDPIVRRTIFGIGRVDLTRRTFDFTPVGPSAAGPGVMPLRLTPDRKTGYTIAFLGGSTDRRTEFWVFDLATRKVINKVEFPSPMGVRLAVSGSGKQLYLYGAAPYIEVYDAATLKLRKTIDFNSDLTTGMIIVPPRPS